MRFVRCLNLVFLLAAFSSSFASARELYVSSQSGNDKNEGLKSASPLQTIAAAAKVAKAGDEVILQPGVYFNWRTPIQCRGTEKQPIQFRADNVAEGRVVITAADPAIREGKTKWRLEDKKLGLYSALYETGKRGRPSRVLYSGTDLYPYNSLEHLRTFIAHDNIPGPRHGFFYDVEKVTLYVRLHASDKYGAADPAKHVMSVSPKEGQCLSLRGDQPAHVIFDGISFETSGQSAVGLEGSHVTLRRCWFKGCLGAIRGGSSVTIEYCNFTHFPAYDDATEVLLEKKISASNVSDTHALIWQRKHRDHGCATQDYEDGGLAMSMREGWNIHHNLVHDCFEGLAGSGMSESVGAKIHDNIFARICDNAIETENHANDVYIYNNLFVDCLDTISYQPGSGPPWPGPILFHGNVITSTPEHAAVWPFSNPVGASAFKIGISLKNWAKGKNANVPKSPLAAPAPGLYFMNNSLYLPNAKIFNPLGSSKVPIDRVYWLQNLFITDRLASMKADGMQEGHFGFKKNLSAPATANGAGPGAFVAGEGGQTLSFADLKNSPLVRIVTRSIELPGGRTLEFGVPLGAGGSAAEWGAAGKAKDWQPPKVGPLAGAGL